MFNPTKAKTPAEYIAMIEAPRKAEIVTLHQLIKKTVPKLKPFILSGMIGYGKYHYKYPSGREGDWAVLLLASQKNYFSLYVCCIKEGKYLADSYKKKLPQADIGKSCVRFKKLADVDLKVITAMIKEAGKLGGMAAV